MPNHFICFVIFCITACWTAGDVPYGGHDDTITIDHS
jgi:hypothetical protein